MRKLVACAVGGGAALGVMLAPVSAYAATSHLSPGLGSGVSTTTAPTGGGDPDKVPDAFEAAKAALERIVA